LAADGDVGFQADYAADIENDGAVGFADGIAERAGAGIVERGDVKRFAAAPAARELAEAFRAGKGERFVLRLRQLQGREAGERNQTG